MQFSASSLTLLIGDAITLGLVTVIGFASHDRLGTAGLRIMTTYLPLLVAWMLIAPHLKALEVKSAADVHQLWRPVWAMFLTAPLAAFLRSLWLDNPILPVFVIVLGGTSALAILIWRSIYLILVIRSGRSHG